jgi:hypothetical protein
MNGPLPAMISGVEKSQAGPKNHYQKKAISLPPTRKRDPYT